MSPELPKPLVPKFFKKLGFAVFRHRKGHVYCPERFVRKALKLVGVEEISPFRELAGEVIDHKRTLLDFDRLYTLYQALLNAKNTASHNESIAEVGVYKGGSAYFMAKTVQRFFEKKPKIFVFDTFEGHSQVDLNAALDGPHTSEKFVDTSFSEVADYLSVFDNVVIYQGRFQDRCGEIQEEAFSLAHIDVDIYEPTSACLDFFCSRLKAGGIIVIDDYGYKTCAGAKQAVDEFLDRNDQFVKFHLTTGQCILVKISERTPTVERKI